VSTTSSVRAWFVENPFQEGPASSSRGADERVQTPMFARAQSRRGRDVLAGAMALVLIGAVWSVGVWMTGNVARALQQTQRLEIACSLRTAVSRDGALSMLFGTGRTGRLPAADAARGVDAGTIGLLDANG
jgi:hypothetical protein